VNILSWILFGLVAGAVARLVVRGRQEIGCLATIAVGIIGALIGGLIGEVVLGEEVRFRWDFGPFLLAVAGSVILLLALEALSSQALAEEGDCERDQGDHHEPDGCAQHGAHEGSYGRPTHQVSATFLTSFLSPESDFEGFSPSGEGLRPLRP
jgi:uncharacterized membrane protein YeaQ/YmgE (transglycosylase-associated protein family)